MRLTFTLCVEYLEPVTYLAKDFNMLLNVAIIPAVGCMRVCSALAYLGCMIRVRMGW
jgi:hypothetical protein